MIKNIFFDFNGTILNDTDLCFDIEASMMKEANMEPVTLEYYLDNFCFPVKNYYKQLGFDVSQENYDKISKRFFSEYLKRESKETYLYDGIEDLLSKLKKEGYKLYILSASEDTILRKQLESLGILKYFDGLAASKNIHALGKIEYGQLFIEENNINPNETIMIGDTYHDYEVAKALKLQPILFTKGHNSRKVLEKTCVPLVDSFEDFYKYIISQDK